MVMKKKRLSSIGSRGAKVPSKIRAKPSETSRKPNIFHESKQSQTKDPSKSMSKLPLMKAVALGVWHMDAMELEDKVLGIEGKKTTSNDVKNWKDLVSDRSKFAERLWMLYSHDYESSRGKTGDIKMLLTTQKSGTSSDKVSAFSIIVADNPIANRRSLDSLLSMVAAKVGKRHALVGFDSLRELFILNLLPERKLKHFFQRPLDRLPNSKDGNSLLLFWYWEDYLKQIYEKFISALEEASSDVLPVLKDRSLKTIYLLLSSKPEQERRLLSTIVNKLGDPDHKVASNSHFHLSNLLCCHPNMNSVVVDEVDSLLFRPRLGLRAKYQAVNFLNQFRLGNVGDGPMLAKRLIDIYFSVFKILIYEGEGDKSKEKGKKKKGRSLSHSKNITERDSLNSCMDSRILSAILTGVNRAFPFVSSHEVDDLIQVQTPLLFRLVHSKNFNVGVQALMLLDKISAKNQIVSDRFYRALYSKLLLPSSLNSSKVEMLIGLLMRAMKNDINMKRVAAFAKRILQVSLQQSAEYACGCLFLISETLKAKPSLWNMVSQNESGDEDIEHFEDVLEDLTEKSQKEIRGEDSMESDNDCPGSVDNAASGLSDSSSDNDSSETEGWRLSENNPDYQGSKPTPADKGSCLNEGSQLFPPKGYNPRHREPSFCNADYVSWWELMVLACHIHPSVSTMATTLLSGAHIVYNGNPLKDLSLMSFLNKLMEKKPKQSTWHGASQIEPAKNMSTSNHLVGAEILSLAEEEVPPEDLVFHKFYMSKTSSLNKRKKRKVKDRDDTELLFDIGENSEEEIDELLNTTDRNIDEDDDKFDYDELDNVDDEELIDDASDIEMDNMEIENDTDDDMDNSGSTKIRDHTNQIRMKANKFKKSSFASVEDFEHLFDSHTDEKVRKKRASSQNKKKKL